MSSSLAWCLEPLWNEDAVRAQREISPALENVQAALQHHRRNMRKIPPKREWKSWNKGTGMGSEELRAYKTQKMRESRARARER